MLKALLKKIRHSNRQADTASCSDGEGDVQPDALSMPSEKRKIAINPRLSLLSLAMVPFYIICQNQIQYSIFKIFK